MRAQASAVDPPTSDGSVGAPPASALGAASHPGPGPRRRTPIRLVVAEASYLIRDVLTTVLRSAPEVELVAICSSEREREAAARRWHPDVIVTDFRMPPTRGERALRVLSLQDAHPEIGVVVLSQYAEPAYAIALLDRASGRGAYLLTERIRDKDALIHAIQSVMDGGAVVDPMIVDLLIKARARVPRSGVAQLTVGERELLADITTGKTNGAIAATHKLTPDTVDQQVNSIFAKLNLLEPKDLNRRVKMTLSFLVEEDKGQFLRLPPA